MTFKKDGADPITARPNIIAWDLAARPTVSMGGLSWVVNNAFAALGFDLDELLGRRGQKFYDGFRYRRSGRGRGKVTPARARPNMLHVSKRVRRKHRRAKAAA